MDNFKIRKVFEFTDMPKDIQDAYRLLKGDSFRNDIMLDELVDDYIFNNGKLYYPKEDVVNSKLLYDYLIANGAVHKERVIIDICW